MAVEGDEVETGGEDARTLALSDGVFAIALTLLVLSLHAPEGPASQVGSQLLEQRGEFFAWLLSFAVIAMNWLRHRTLFRQIGEVDVTTARLNLAYLATISFLPFPTDVIASFGSEWQSVALYAVTLALVATLLAAIAIHADVPDHSRFWWLTPLVMLAAIPLSLAIGALALLVWLLMPLAGRVRG